MAEPRPTDALTHIRKLFAARGRDALGDRDLLNRFLKDGDEAAVTALVERHGAMVLGVCRRVLGHDHDAEDACQAAFLVLVRKAASLRKKDSLGSWLHGVALHVATNLKRDRARRRRRESAAGRVPELDAAEELTWRKAQTVLDEELARLPERFRAPLVLCYLEGKTRDEAAKHLGWTLGTVRGRLERGRDLLRTRLTRRGLAVSAALAACQLGTDATSAAMSPTLVISTMRVVVSAVVGNVPAHIAALSQTVVKAMFVKKIKVAAVLLLAIAGGGVGLVVATLPRAEARDPVQQPAAKAPLRPDAGAKPAADPTLPIRSLLGHRERVAGASEGQRVTSVAYSFDGRWIVTAAWDGTARVWDARTGEEVRRLNVPPTKDFNPARLHQVAFSPDGEFVVTVLGDWEDKSVTVWKRSTGEQVRWFSGGCVAFSPDGKHIACGQWTNSNAGVIALYEFATGKRVRELRGHQSRVDLVTFSPDGKTLYAQVRIPRPPLGGGVERLGRDGAQVRVWGVVTGKERQTGLEGAWNEHHITVAPDGRAIAVQGAAGSKSVSLRETATGGRRVELTGHKSEVCGVAFSPDGRTVATGSMDGTVRLWDLPTGKELARFGKLVDPFKGGWVLSVAFSPDGQTLVSGGLDEAAHVWDVSTIAGRPRASAERSPSDLDADWKDLAGDAAAGYAAIGHLAASPRSAVAFLGKQLQNVPPIDAKRVERLIGGLDDGRFQVREQAIKELESLAERAAPLLRQALAGNPSAETRRRLTALLDRLDAAIPLPETVRQIRAVEALEMIGNPEARRLLDTLVAGPAEFRLTQEARAAAERLAKGRRQP